MMERHLQVTNVIESIPSARYFVKESGRLLLAMLGEASRYQNVSGEFLNA